MLTSDFKEKSSSEIPLPEKSYQAVLEMLLCITPGINNHITCELLYFSLKYLINIIYVYIFAYLSMYILLMSISI